MAVSVFTPAVSVADTGTDNSRIMSLKPHTDGWLMVPAGSGLGVSNSNLALTRNGAGDWSLNRTAAGAETYYVRTTLGQILRIGEPFQFGTFGGPGVGTSKPPYPSKGIGVIDIAVVLQIGVVALTSATLRLGKTVYSKTLAPVQTDIVAATALGSLATNANELVQVVSVPAGTQQFNTDDLSLVEVELALVMANTGTVQISGLGAHLAFNWN